MVFLRRQRMRVQPLAVLQPRLDTSSIPGVQPDLYQAMATTALQKMRTLTSDYCIGTGGYGSVCRAQLPSGKIFALKKLHRLNRGTSF